MPCPRDAAGLGHICTLSWICGKNKKQLYGEKLLQSIMFSRKNYKDKFLTRLIFKK